MSVADNIAFREVRPRLRSPPRRLRLERQRFLGAMRARWINSLQDQDLHAVRCRLLRSWRQRSARCWHASLSGDVEVLIAANPCFGFDFAAVALDPCRDHGRPRNRGAAVLVDKEDLDELLELPDRLGRDVPRHALVHEASIAEAAPHRDRLAYYGHWCSPRPERILAMRSGFLPRRQHDKVRCRPGVGRDQ